ncbi:MAG: hypothetical protein WKF73_07490 [Nocardioidaceae bacterium]
MALTELTAVSAVGRVHLKRRFRPHFPPLPYRRRSRPEDIPTTALVPGAAPEQAPEAPRLRHRRRCWGSRCRWRR